MIIYSISGAANNLEKILKEEEKDLFYPKKELFIRFLSSAYEAGKRETEDKLTRNGIDYWIGGG